VETLETAGAQFNRAVETSEVSFIANGTDLSVRWRGNAELNVETDGAATTPLMTSSSEDGWNTTILHRSLTPQQASFRLSSDNPLELDSIAVYNRTIPNLYPLIAGAMAITGILLYVILSAFRARRQQQ
jgi:hypothetical protein